ncbi:MAG: M20 family metallopeptidase [Phycisphaerales bacterium]
MDADRLRTLIRAELPGLKELRHDLHRHPELGFKEERTSGVVRRELTALGVPFKAGVAGTGVVAHLPATTPGGRDAPAVALRADMDALPIAEATGRPYASATPGLMHACGHDGHTTILIGAARVLSKLDRPRPVTLLFQPAEEGGAGAEKMCTQGALKGAAGGGIGTPVGRVFGLHGWPYMELGVVGSRPGPLLAATDEWEIEVIGRGGHAAIPHLARDPIVAASHVVAALQTIASRVVNPVDAVVCTVGTFQAGTATNIIPDSAKLTGTVRSLSPAVRELAKANLFSISERTAEAFGCRARVVWHDGYPVTHNDAGETERFFAAAREALGAGAVRVLDAPIMGAEDFSYYGRHAPACFFFLGLKPPAAASYPLLHTPEFDFNDDALPIGVELMCRLAVSPG